MDALGELQAASRALQVANWSATAITEIKRFKPMAKRLFCFSYTLIHKRCVEFCKLSLPTTLNARHL